MVARPVFKIFTFVRNSAYEISMQKGLHKPEMFILDIPCLPTGRHLTVKNKIINR